MRGGDTHSCRGHNGCNARSRVARHRRNMIPTALLEAHADSNTVDTTAVRSSDGLGRYLAWLSVVKGSCFFFLIRRSPHLMCQAISQSSPREARHCNSFVFSYRFVLLFLFQCLCVLILCSMFASAYLPCKVGVCSFVLRGLRERGVKRDTRRGLRWRYICSDSDIRTGS